MSDNPYHLVPYSTVAMAQTHPDRLASVATLFGITPAPVAECRVLEVGCGDGGNLIPMAHTLPGSRFTGIDLAPEPIAEGRRIAAELAIPNVELIAMDLRDVSPDMGEFDYIIAHGVYSWIPDEIRDSLLALCRERLAPNGVAFISYNALPGRHVRMMFREMMRYHTRHTADPSRQIEEARSLLQMVGEARLVSQAWQPVIDQEIEQLLAGHTGWLYHDDLSPINDSFYIRDFAARAASHSLQYLGDAETHLMFDVKNALNWVRDDVLEREQYFDFLCFRRFRQTLLCRNELLLQRPAGPEKMDRFLFTSPARRIETRFEGLNSVLIENPPEPVARVAAVLGQAYPLPVSFDDLLDCVPDRDALRAILFALICSGFAQFHVHDFTCHAEVTDHPRATRLARWESERGGKVTWSNLLAVKLGPIDRALIALLDGTRDLSAITAALAQVNGAPPIDQIRRHLPILLDHMASTGLLGD